MVQTCSAFSCNNVYDKKKGITLHTFPMKDQELLAKWIQAVKRYNWKPTKNSRLCSAHFEEKDFYPGQSKRILRYNVVPTIFAHRLTTKKRPPLKKQEDLEVSSGLQRPIVILPVEHLSSS